MKPSQKAIEVAYQKLENGGWNLVGVANLNVIEAIESAYAIDVDPEIERLKESLDGMMVNKGVFMALQEEVIAKEQRIAALEAENARFRQEYDPRHERHCQCAGCRRFNAILRGEP